MFNWAELFFAGLDLISSIIELYVRNWTWTGVFLLYRPGCPCPIQLHRSNKCVRVTELTNSTLFPNVLSNSQQQFHRGPLHQIDEQHWSVAQLNSTGHVLFAGVASGDSPRTLRLGYPLNLDSIARQGVRLVHYV